MSGPTGCLANIAIRHHVAVSLTIFLCGLGAIAAGVTRRAGFYGGHGHLEVEPVLLAAGLLLIVAAARLCRPR